MPTLLLRLVTADDTSPVDIGFLSPFSSSAESFYPPGLYLEQRKESMDVLSGVDGDDVHCKVVEIAPHVHRVSGMGKGAKTAAAVAVAPVSSAP